MAHIIHLDSGYEGSLEPLPIFWIEKFAAHEINCISPGRDRNSVATISSCDRLPYRFLIHRTVWEKGLCQRHPKFLPRQVFEPPFVETFVKLNKLGHLVYGAPDQVRLVKRSGDATLWYLPDQPLVEQRQSAKVIEIHEVHPRLTDFHRLAQKVFPVLETFAQILVRELFFVELEFGLDEDNELRLFSDFQLYLHKPLKAEQTCHPLDPSDWQEINGVM